MRTAERPKPMHVRLWEIGDIVKLVEDAEEPKLGKRGPYKGRSAN